MTTSTYKIIPDESDIAAIERDLRFYPSTVDNRAVLSREQIEQFNRDGYVRADPHLRRRRDRRHRRYFDDLLAKVMAAGGDSYSISTRPSEVRPGVRPADPPADRGLRAATCWATNVVGWGSHFFCKMPRDGKAVAWHQDASYWPLTPSKAVTVWLAIDDADAENACMRFIPGSHHLGHLTYRPSDDGRAQRAQSDDRERRAVRRPGGRRACRRARFRCTPTCCCTARRRTIPTAAAAA